MHFFGYYVLNLKPTVLAYLGSPLEIPAWMQPDAVLEHVSWWQGDWRKMIRWKARQWRTIAKGVDHHLMVHAYDEELLRKRFHVQGALISQNIYLNENVFNVQHSPIEFDAVYVARLDRFKRHELAKDIKRLAIIAGEPGQLKEFCPEVAHAYTSPTRLNKVQLAALYGRTNCSLALSAVEGGMLVSFESLLCGVPVVSTESKGGRDLFFDQYNSRIVPANSYAVKDAVDSFLQSPPDRKRVRQEALDKLAVHRHKFCEYVASVVVKHGGQRIPTDVLERRYFSGNGITDLFVWADKAHIPEVRSAVEARLAMQ